MGPVIGQRVKFSATKECARFLRINNALIPFFVVKSLNKAFVFKFRSQIILKELSFLLEKVFFCTPSFSQARLKKSWVLETGSSQSSMSTVRTLSFILATADEIVFEISVPLPSKTLLNMCRVSLLPHQLPGVPAMAESSGIVISDKKHFDLVFKCQIINRKRISLCF